MVKNSQGGAIVSQPAAIATKSKTKRSSKERIKSSTVAIYASVFTLLVSVVAIGYRAPEESVVAASTNNSASSSNVVTMTTLMASGKVSTDDVLAASVAASVASIADLSISGNINELAASVQIQNQYSSVEDSSSITKPTIVELSTASRNIETYTVLEGDTLKSIADKFGISVETLKWANDISVDSVQVGKVLDILPRNGIVYTVKSGDSLNGLADKYKADASLISTYNDLEISGLTEGLKIIIPNGKLPEKEQPGYVAPVPVYTGFVSGYGAWSGSVLSMTAFYAVDSNSGGYAPGNCTAYAYYRRAQIGRPVPSNLGNAFTWATQARALGYTVNKQPAFGAVIQSGNHVGVVEEVLPNGDLRIKDMNYGYRLYNLAERIIPASTVGNYMYIH